MVPIVGGFFVPLLEVCVNLVEYYSLCSLTVLAAVDYFSLGLVSLLWEVYSPLATLGAPLVVRQDAVLMPLW